MLKNLLVILLFLALSGHVRTADANALAQISVSEVKLSHFGGGSSSLNDYKGKVVIINFWATWCGSCIKELDSLKSMQQDLQKDAKLILASIDNFDAERLTKCIEKNSMAQFDIVWAAQLSSNYNIKAVPTTIILDHEGREVERIVGVIDWNDLKLQNLIKNLIKQAQISSVKAVHGAKNA